MRLCEGEGWFVRLRDYTNKVALHILVKRIKFIHTNNIIDLCNTLRLRLQLSLALSHTFSIDTLTELVIRNGNTTTETVKVTNKGTELCVFIIKSLPLSDYILYLKVLQQRTIYTGQFILRSHTKQMILIKQLPSACSFTFYGMVLVEVVLFKY